MSVDNLPEGTQIENEKAASSVMGEEGVNGSLFQIGKNVELEIMLLHLSIVVVLIVLLEHLLHALDHKLKRYPKYHEMMTKAFGELMILGFIGLWIKFLKELAGLNAYSTTMIAFQAADLAVFIMAVGLIIQAVCVFMRLRVQNMLWDKAELIGSEELHATIRAHQESKAATNGTAQPARTEAAPRSIRASVRNVTEQRRHINPSDFYDLVQMRLIRHFFLKKMQLPELFPFAKYLRQAQENQITHMIEVEVSMWIMLLVIGWLLHLVSELFESEDELLEYEAIIPSFMIFSWLSVVLHIAVSQYFSWAIRQVLFAAGHFTGRSNWLVCLEEVAVDEIKSANSEIVIEAIQTMEHVRDQVAANDKGRHSLLMKDKGFQLVSIVAHNAKQRVASRRSSNSGGQGNQAAASDQQQSKTAHAVWIRWFNREAWHFVVVSTMMLNAFYFALFAECIAHQFDTLYEKSGLWMIFLLIVPLIVNTCIFQPRILWGFTLVSSVVRVDVTALSNVIEHFTETIQLRSELVTTMLAHLEENSHGTEWVHDALAVYDPENTGLIDVDDMREVLRHCGVQLSYYRFNSVARLIFDMKGTNVPYNQLLRLLELGGESAEWSATSKVKSDVGQAVSLSEEHPHLAHLGVVPLTSSQPGSPSPSPSPRPHAPTRSERQPSAVEDFAMSHATLDGTRRTRMLSTAQRPSMLHLATTHMARSLYRLEVQDQIAEGDEQQVPRRRATARKPSRQREDVTIVTHDVSDHGSTTQSFQRL